MAEKPVARRTSLDGAWRRRIYLFRHGSVDYFDADGQVVADTNAVALNARGREQATAMASLFAGIEIDKAICSGLPRTRQTGEIILGQRNIPLESDAGFAEIQQMKSELRPDSDLVADIAFTHWRAAENDARFLGGERYSDFYARIASSIERTLAEPDWDSLAVFAHGGSNAAILGWVTGLELDAFGVLDQQTCCLNVIDIDSGDDGKPLRKTVRAVNVTADDPLKGGRLLGDMEAMARWMLKTRA